MPSEEEANGASPAPAPPPSSSSSRPPPSQPPPAYAQAKNAYEALWKQQSDTRPLATQAPASGAAGAARTAAAASPRPEATAAGVNAAAAARSPAPPPLKLHAFQRLVGDEAFIPASSLKILKRIGAGSFATVEVAEYVPANYPPGTPPLRVAVKRLRKGSALDAVDLAHEARVLRGLSHRHITKYIGVGASQSTRGGPLIDEHCYIVQAFVGGGTLKRVVAAQTEATRASLSSPSLVPPSLPASSATGPNSSSSSPAAPVGCIRYFYTHEDAATWGAQIAEGLAYLHGANPVILHRDLKLENVLLTEAPSARERKIYPPPPKAAEAAVAAAAAASGSPGSSGRRNKAAAAAAEAAAAAAAAAASKASKAAEEEEAAARAKAKAKAGSSRPEAKLADFGLAVSFVSPDIDTRRSTLPRYVSSLTSAAFGGGFGGGGGGGGAGKEKEKEKEEAAAAAAAGQAPQQQQRDKLGDRRVSVVQAQMLRADAGQEMNDAAVARAASELETALSRWTGVDAAAVAAATAGAASEGAKPSGAAAPLLLPKSSSAAATAGGSTPPTSSTPLAAAKTTTAPTAAAASASADKPAAAAAPLTTRRGSVSSLLRATNRRVYALTGKTGSYLYMAPEVTLSLPYNEQADVFSLGTVLWELLSRQTVGAAVLAGATGDLARVAELYAHRVARGFRPPLPKTWPEEVRALVTDCWDARPAARPRAGEVGKRLRAMVEKGTFAEFDRAREKEEDEAVWEAAAEARRLKERGVAAEIAGCLGCCSVM